MALSPAYFLCEALFAREYGITPPEPQWEPHFQVRTLTAYRPRLRGPFAYPEPFDNV